MDLRTRHAIFLYAPKRSQGKCLLNNLKPQSIAHFLRLLVLGQGEKLAGYQV